MDIMDLHRVVMNARNGRYMAKYIKLLSYYLNIFKVNFLFKEKYYQCIMWFTKYIKNKIVFILLIRRGRKSDNSCRSYCIHEVVQYHLNVGCDY